MGKKRRDEAIHEFVLIATGVAALDDDVASALYDAGCSDATVSMRFGNLHVTFARKAACKADAIVGAIHDVEKAGIGATVLRIDDCSLVTAAEIARRIGRSRQLVHQYVAGQRGPGSFPRPIANVANKSPLWMWCDVARWLNESHLVRNEVSTDALEVGAMNAALDLRYYRRLNPELTERALDAVAG